MTSDEEKENKLLEFFLLDEAFFRIPLEYTNSLLRSGYQHLKHDMIRLDVYVTRHSESVKLLRQLNETPICFDESKNRKALLLLSSVMNFIKQFKEKIKVYRTELEKNTRAILKRLKIVEDESIWPSLSTMSRLGISGPQRDTNQVLSIHDTEHFFSSISLRLDTYIYEYLMRCGIVKTATQLKEFSGLHDLVNDDFLHNIIKLKQSLVKHHDTEPALKWCTFHRSRLEKQKNDLLKELQFQLILDTVTKEGSLATIKRIREHFTLQDLKRGKFSDFQWVLLLLASPSVTPLGDHVNNEGFNQFKEKLCDQSTWELCAQHVERSIYSVYGLPMRCPLEILLLCGASTLKHKIVSNTLSPSCPTCNVSWTSWFQELIGTQHLLSFFVCPVKKHVMSDTDLPLVSPQGVLVSTSAVRELSECSLDGLVKQMSQEMFAFRLSKNLFFLNTILEKWFNSSLQFNKEYLTQSFLILARLVISLNRERDSFFLQTLWFKKKILLSFGASIMSSLAAARADNFYYPPDYRREHGSLNQYRHSNPLGKRAKRLNEGILTIRFEMPYKAFCTQCKEVIAKGVRFNAEKKTVGMYFSTKILEFKMTCCFCSNIFRIRTNPKACDYTVVEGLTRKTESFSCEDAQTLEFRSVEERHAIESDPVLKLETVLEDKEKAGSAFSELESLIKLQSMKFSEGRDYLSNADLRRSFRSQTQTILKEQAKQNCNFVLALPSPSTDDFCEASSIQFYTKRYQAQLSKRVKNVEAQTSSLFSEKENSFLPASIRHLKKKNACSSLVKKKTQTKIVPTEHPALSQVIRIHEKSKPVTAERPHERERRLHTCLEQLTFSQRLAHRHSILNPTNV